MTKSTHRQAHVHTHTLKNTHTHTISPTKYTSIFHTFLHECIDIRVRTNIPHTQAHIANTYAITTKVITQHTPTQLTAQMTEERGPRNIIYSTSYGCIYVVIHTHTHTHTHTHAKKSDTNINTPTPCMQGKTG